jgi:hypothetical protein
MRKRTILCFAAVLLFLVFPAIGYALDSDVTRQTLKGLQGVYVIVEDLQPNIQKYASKAGLANEELKADIERRLTEKGIRIFSRDEWVKTPGTPVLYVSVNTHETEKYWYAYDIKTELQQAVTMEANPKVRTLATTWSINLTGMANVGTLGLIKGDVGVLVGRFIEAYKVVNEQK